MVFSFHREVFCVKWSRGTMDWSNTTFTNHLSSRDSTI